MKGWASPAQLDHRADAWRPAVGGNTRRRSLKIWGHSGNGSGGNNTEFKGAGLESRHGTSVRTVRGPPIRRCR